MMRNEVLLVLMLALASTGEAMNLCDGFGFLGWLRFVVTQIASGGNSNKQQIATATTMQIA